MFFLQNLKAFFSERRRCGDLESEGRTESSAQFVIVCICGVWIA